MPCGCLGSCLALLVVFGLNFFFASSSQQCGRDYTSCNANASTMAQSLLQVSHINFRTELHFEEEEPQKSTNQVLMQGSRAANKTWSGEGVALTQQPNPNVDCHTWWQASRKRWHACLLAFQKKTLFLAEVASRALQAVQAFCHKTIFRMSTAQLTSVGLILRQAAAQGTIGLWGWVCLAMGLGIALIVVTMSLGTDKHWDRSHFPTQRVGMHPPNIDMPGRSAKFSPHASDKLGQNASLLAARSPRGFAMLGEGPFASARDRGKTFASSSQHITTMPESDLLVTATASSPTSMQPPNLDIGACLCPELVVPPNCECNLRVPVKAGGGSSSINVVDMNGCEVMRIMFLKEGGQQQILVTGYGDILAQCRPALGICGEFHLFRSHGQYFGKLVQGSDRHEYCVQTASGAVLTFRGSAHSVSITDTGGRLLAMTEPEVGERASSCGNEAYILRVAPLMDVSIVTCGMMIINHLI